jgi:F420-dependent oxidoreductase-like protein
MQLRIMTEPQQGATYDDLLRVAKATEELGFDAFFRSDHYQRIGDGDGRPGPTDAWTTLAGLARETTRIRLGTMVTPATFRYPGPLAITVATVDAMSGGRVEFGFGAGWYDGEHAAYGIPYPDTGERFDRFAEQLEIIDGLWRTADGATYSFAGGYYRLSDSPALPKPAQSPRPPIILGGAGRRRSAELAARFADEYNVAFRGPAETREVIERVRAVATERPLVYSAAQTLCVGSDDAQVARRAAAIGQDVAELRDGGGLVGTPAQVLEQVAALAELGVERIYLQTMDLADLAHLELVAAEVLPHV